LVSHFGHLIPQETDPGAHWTGRRLDPRVFLNLVTEECPFPAGI